MTSHFPVQRPALAAVRTDAVPQDDFRDGISLMPTGVSVVSALRNDGPIGCTANAVMSLSLDPPSLLVSLTTSSRALNAVTNAGTFAINILAWPDRHLAQRFASAAPEQRFQQIPWSPTRGAPVLDRSTLTAVCEVSETVPLLDQTVVTGTIVWLRTEGGDPTVLHSHRQHVLHP